jgi:glycosyltransferase involved in cell wall biosynthesis
MTPSTDPQIKPFLENLTREDRRIKVLFRDKNGHISACSNSALSLARGEWCALLDQDDELAEDALAEVACEIRRNLDAAIVYSDEDFLDVNGARSNPFLNRIGTRSFSLHKITSIILASTALLYFTRSADSAKDSRARRITI